jgi:hypothetical protein
LSVGLLSDDFVLSALARRLEFGPVHREFFRPLPLMVWSAILRLIGPVGLHALNVVAHGLVAFLTSRLVDPLVGSRRTAIAAGLLVLTFPAAVEPVTWSSGVFDVTATLLALAAVLFARRYGAGTDVRTRAAMVACAFAALMCKEVAIVAPMLIALDAWALRRWSRRLLADLVSLAIVFAGIGATRLSLSSELVRQPLSKYVVQRWLFGTVGGLAVPWHSQVADRWPWIPMASALLTIAVATTFFLTRQSLDTTRTAAMAAGWLLLACAPTLTFFFVAPDLQGARYLYLPVVGYALLLAVMAGGRGSGVWFLGTAALAFLVLSGAVGVRAHQRFWRDAAASRDTLIDTARRDGRLRTCREIAIVGLPDTVDGAYVFRNGADIAFANVGLTLSRTASPSCTFEWDRERGVFLSEVP